MVKKLNLLGKKFDRLTVIKEYGRDKNKQVLWLCKCECGKNVVHRSGDLTSKHVKSCGCLKNELVSKRITQYNKENKLKHGDSFSKLYGVWHCMKQRCYCKTYRNYCDWGGRGITVCDEWKNDYRAFKKWAMENGYKEGLSIDRINNNGNYEPKNCRWTTPLEQANNRRNSKHLMYNGEEHSVVEWAKIMGIDREIIYHRLSAGWSIEKTLTTPVRKKNQK